MDRRKFFTNTAAATALGGLTSFCQFPGEAEQTEQTSLIKPSKLSAGDKIGIITPGSGLLAGQYETIVENIEKTGLTPVYSKYLRSQNGFIAGTDEQRLEDLHTMFEDDSIKAIICGRGGYGSARILDQIDYTLIRNNPKVFVGFSDITALHSAFLKNSGLVSFHGPVGASVFSDYTLKNFKSVLMRGEQTSFQTNSDYYVIEGGETSGQLVGGNLSIVMSLMGTPYELDMDGKILFLEEIGEKPYRIDRMLTQLSLAGKLQKLKGIVLGNWAHCDVSASLKTSFTLKETLKERLGDLGIPCAYGFKIGHVDDNSTLPFGLSVYFDADNKILKLLEKPVV